MRSSSMFVLGAVFAGLAVGLGAFGAHAMSAYPPHDLETWDKAVRYQMYHALALFLCGLLQSRGFATRGAAVSFLLGVLLFSGSLYTLVLSGMHWLGAVTPVGGVAFLVGWGLLAWRAACAPESTQA